MAINLPQNLNIGMPQQLKYSRNFLMEIVLLVIVCGLFGWFIVLPKKASVAAQATVLASYTSQEQSAANSLNTINTLVQELKNDSSQVAQLDQAMPLDNKPDNPQLLIQALAASSGVTLGDVTLANNNDPNEVSAGDTALINDPYGTARTLQTLSGTVYVIGTFPQLEDFLKKIESSGRLMEVTSIEIGGSEGSNLNLKIGLNAYYLAP